MSGARPPAAAGRPHWIVLANYRLRGTSYALSFAVVGAHLWETGAGAATWSLLALQFLLLPHLMFWRARRARDSQTAELNNLLADSVMLGMWAAALQFPAWLTFNFWLGTSLNITISQGRRGIVLAILTFAGGVLVSLCLFGLHFAPQMGALSTALCLMGMTVFLLALGNASYGRNQTLRKTRHQLRLREQTLYATNADLAAAHRNISLLSEFGKEITAMLDREAIMTTVCHRVSAQMAADVFSVGICREGRIGIEFPFVVAHGVRVKGAGTGVADTADMNGAADVNGVAEVSGVAAGAGAAGVETEMARLAMLCVTSGKEIFVGGREADPTLEPDVGNFGDGRQMGNIGNMGNLGEGGEGGDAAGSAGRHDGGRPGVPVSMLYAPLAIKGRVLGVLSVQSFTSHVYERVHRDMLATLASYTAVALDNADAYERLGEAITALKDAQQQLVLQEKMASLGTLTAGIAHEINNPANFAHVGAQALTQAIERFRATLIDLAGDDAEPEILAYLNQRIDELLGEAGVIVEGTTRIRDLVKDLRTFSRLDEADRKTVSIAASLLSTVRLVRVQYADAIEFVCDLEANAVLECWPAQLNQVFMNLIVNACHAIEDKQRTSAAFTRGVLRICSRIEDGQLLIEFEDNGCGIAPAAIDHIFEPFFTTKPVGSGVGLGLAISYGIVGRHLGELTVRSVLGEGSCFAVRLPLRQTLLV